MTVLKRCTFVLFSIAVLCATWYGVGTVFIESAQPLRAAPAGTLFAPLPSGEVIAYSEVDNNAATTVVFIGGLSAWHGTWERTIAARQKDTTRNYIAIDLPPFGYSTIPRGALFTRDAQAARILAFLQEKQLARVILVAHSYGAGPAAEALLEDSEHRIVKFIVIDGVLNIDELRQAPSALVMNDFLRTVAIGMLVHVQPIAQNRLESFVYKKENIDGALTALYTQSFDTRGTTQKLSAWVKAYVSDPLDYASTKRASYRALTVPVRILWGTEDTLTPIALGRALEDAVPHAIFYELLGVGHIPMIEDYAQFDDTLEKALRE